MGAGHPECPERLDAISDFLTSTRLMQYLAPCEAPLATREQLALAHTAGYVAEIHAAAPSEGYLHVERRADDLIIRGGENTSPAEIEDVLLRHDAVEEAAVVGIPDVEWGERIGAVIVLREGHTATADELRDFVKAHLRSSKAPDLVAFRDELPYTDTGKLLRRQVRDDLAAGSA